ncbi:MAG: hypothetical protein ACI392_07990 [Paludibacteraceae bacterium]
MKSLLKIAAFAALVVTFAACDESPVKSDYDPVADPNNAPKGVVTYDADVYQTKVRLSGKVSDYANLVDYGFVYCPDSVLDNAKGNIETALMSGYVKGKNVCSLKGLAESDELSYVSTVFSPNSTYYYVAYALNNNGITFGDPVLFETQDSYEDVFAWTPKSTQKEWEILTTLAKATEGDVIPFEYYENGVGSNMTTCMRSSAKKGPTILHPDNWLVTPAIDLGIDMKIDYLIYPSATRASEAVEKYAIYLSEDSITDENCLALAAEEKLVVLDSLTFQFPEGTLTDAQKKIEKTLDIPAEYEGKHVWIAVRHFEKYSRMLIVEKLRIY